VEECHCRVTMPVRWMALPSNGHEISDECVGTRRGHPPAGMAPALSVARSGEGQLSSGRGARNPSFCRSL